MKDERFEDDQIRCSPDIEVGQTLVSDVVSCVCCCSKALWSRLDMSASKEFRSVCETKQRV